MLRMLNPSIEAVEQALYEARSLIRHHAMRRTLWVATPEVARLMHAAATRALVGQERKRTCALLAANGIADPESWLALAEDQVLAHLRRHGPSTARQVGERLPDLKHPLRLAPGKSYGTTQSAHTRVLPILGFQGAVLRVRPTGSWVSAGYGFVGTDSWLPGGLGELDPAEAAAALATRWLSRFGPATTKDLQWWMGWTLGRTKQALRDAGAVLVELDGTTGWLIVDDVAPEPAAESWVAVLPSLDPTTMGWKERGWYLPEAAADAFDRNGNAGPTLWVDGRIVGAWAQTRDGEIHTHYFERVAQRRRRQLDDRIGELKAMVGEARFSVRFPSVIQAILLAPANIAR